MKTGKVIGIVLGSVGLAGSLGGLIYAATKQKRGGAIRGQPFTVPATAEGVEDAARRLDGPLRGLGKEYPVRIMRPLTEEEEKELYAKRRRGAARMKREEEAAQARARRGEYEEAHAARMDWLGSRRPHSKLRTGRPGRSSKPRVMKVMPPEEVEALLKKRRGLRTSGQMLAEEREAEIRAASKEAREGYTPEFGLGRWGRTRYAR
jgi:hypothetical protein